MPNAMLYQSATGEEQWRKHGGGDGEEMVTRKGSKDKVMIMLQKKQSTIAGESAGHMPI